MKTYILTLSKTFPKWHPRHGEPTYFKEKVMDAICVAHGIDRRPKGIIDGLHGYKLHTIRANYELWSKRFKQIAAGEAVLSVRQWSGKPYRSKMIEICRLTKDDGIGIQKLYLTDEINLLGEYGIVESIWELFGIPGDSKVSCKQLAYNDGLSYEDWDTWFEKYDKSKPLAIIHFTKFRY